MLLLTASVIVSPTWDANSPACFGSVVVFMDWFLSAASVAPGGVLPAWCGGQSHHSVVP